MLVESTCKQCNKAFSRKYDARKTPQFCSRLCACRNRNTKKHQTKAARAGGEVIAKRTRRTGNKGYVKNGGRHEHRIVAEQKIGRPLRPGEIVHHIDENKHNNHPDNLQVMTQADHMRLHLHTKPTV